MQAVVTHTSPYSGSWYPGEKPALRDLLERLFNESETRIPPGPAPRAAAIIVPHAGLVYSGAVAAAAYRYLKNQRPERVVVLGFAHHGAPAGVWMPAVQTFRTPLGDVRVDTETVAQLAHEPGFGMLDEDRLCDHSVEIQLPLIQASARGASVVPLYVSSLSARARRLAAEALSRLVREDTVLVASSDFTHYGAAFQFLPFPPDASVSERIGELDHTVIGAASGIRDDIFLSALRETGATVCGYDPIALLLATLNHLEGEREYFQEEIDYRTSGEITGDLDHSVSYAALVYFRDDALRLGPEDESILLESARRTLDMYRKTGERVPATPENKTPALGRRAGVFVSLHRRGELRGCVGRPLGTGPLWQAVPELTLSAALDDSRFEPLERSAEDIDIEISVLTPMKRLADGSELWAGIHGALLEAGYHRGLLLPQVASERGWETRQFLSALSNKAGLPPDAWKESSTRLSVFRAQVFGKH